MDYNRYKKARDYTYKVVIPAFDRLANDEKIDYIEREWYNKQLMQLLSCGDFSYWLECQKCNHNEFAGFSSCTHRYCVPCNIKKSIMWIGKLYPVLTELKRHGKRFSMLNFTIRDTDKLNDGIDLLSKSYRALTNNDQAMRRQLWKERFPGGLRSLEVKRGSGSGRWHPHLHCLVIQDTYQKDYQWIASEWKDVTRGEGSIDIRGIRAGHRIRDPVLAGVVEVTKYILKPEEGIYTNDADLYEVTKTLKGKRQTNTWGYLRGIGSTIDKEVYNFEEKKCADFVCQRCGFDKAVLYSLSEKIISGNFQLVDNSQIRKI